VWTLVPVEMAPWEEVADGALEEVWEEKVV
jgi:hypothetical protein